MNERMSFPFPVLNNSDDVVTTEAPPVELVHTLSGIAVNVELTPSPLTTGNPTIDTLVAEGKASWFFRVHCARTYYRQEFLLDPVKPVITLNTERVEGGVTAELFVVAVANVAGYRPDGIHADYGDANFDVLPGEVLALAWEFEFSIEPRFDPMKADAKSFIQFQKDEEASQGPFRFDLGGDTIVVYLPVKEWDIVNELRIDVPDILHACLALPALIEAISRREVNDTRRWAYRLTALLHERGIDPNDPVEAAQRLLENPLLRGLAQVDRAMRPE